MRAVLSFSCLLALGACAFRHYEELPLAPERAAEELGARRLDAPELAEFARANLGAEAPFPPAVWQLDALVLAAFFYRRELDLARAELAEARAAITSAGARRNPSLILDPEVVPGASNPWILGWKLELPIETANKRGLRVLAAEERARAAELRPPLVAWEVRTSVRRALLELASARAEEALLAREHEARDEHAGALRAMLAAGQISSFELARDELELARLAGERERNRTRNEHALASLAEAVGVPRIALEGVTIEPDRGAAWPGAPEPEAARELGLTNRLDLRAALLDYAATEADLRLEIARQYPDVSLVPGTSWDQGDHKYALGFAIELPLFNHNEGPIAVAEARRAASGVRFLALQEAAIGGIESARVRYAGALRERAAVAEQLALARRQEERTLRAIEAGAVERLAGQEARILRLDLERALAASDEASALALGEFEDQLQRPLEDDGAPVLVPRLTSEEP